MRCLLYLKDSLAKLNMKPFKKSQEDPIPLSNLCISAFYHPKNQGIIFLFSAVLPGLTKLIIIILLLFLSISVYPIENSLLNSVYPQLHIKIPEAFQPDFSKDQILIKVSQTSGYSSQLFSVLIFERDASLPIVELFDPAQQSDGTLTYQWNGFSEPMCEPIKPNQEYIVKLVYLEEPLILDKYIERTLHTLSFITPDFTLSNANNYPRFVLRDPFISDHLENLQLSDYSQSLLSLCSKNYLNGDYSGMVVRVGVQQGCENADYPCNEEIHRSSEQAKVIRDLFINAGIEEDEIFHGAYINKEKANQGPYVEIWY